MNPLPPVPEVKPERPPEKPVKTSCGCSILNTSIR